MSTQPAQLIIQLDGQVYQAVAVAAEALTIGRLPDNDLVLAHPGVWRRHAELRLTASGAQVTDLDSPGGTWVGQQRLLASQPHPLADGDSFQIGPFVLTFRAAGVAAPPPEPGAPAAERADEAIAAASAAAAPPPPPSRRSEPPPLRSPWRASRYMQFLPGIYQEGDRAESFAPSRPPAEDPDFIDVEQLAARDARHDSSFLNRLLLICETIWEPFEQRQDHLERYVDPRTCPASLVPWFAGWLGLRVEPYWPESRQRALLGAAMELYRWRGTAHGLTRMLEVCTGHIVTVEDVPERPFVVRVVVTAAPGQAVDRELIEELIRTHKPAHVGYLLELRQ